MRSALFDQPLRRIKVDDSVIAYRTMGAGPPLLLIHGYPETHVCWHAIAPPLAEQHMLVLPDLPGYGESVAASADDSSASKRAMAELLVQVMHRLGHDRFGVVGHDRGARVAYRMALDHPTTVQSLTVMDIVPTIEEWDRFDGPESIATFHWPFLAQPGGLPETLLAAAPDAWLDHLMSRWARYPERLSPRALDEYRRCFRQREVINGTCADYRAGATIDVEHDESDRRAERMISCPVLVLASADRGDLTDTWRRWANDVWSAVLDSGHFLPEENPDAVMQQMSLFLTPS